MSGLGYDVATALWQGARPYQEDTLLADFHGGLDRGFAILADGMGGHAAGDLASRLVVIDAASHLKFLMHDGCALEKNLRAELTSAIETANDVLKDRAADDHRLLGMGTTFLATVIFEDRLYWASVGDSPLYLWREGKLRQLNEDHSMAPVIDQMAKSGEITQAEAANHPDRNALTSVLMGRPLKMMDVPDTATVLDPGDVLIQASDGLQYLDDTQISDAVAQGGSSRKIADALMAALHDLDDQAQDNTAILVLQLTQSGRSAAATVPGTTAAATERVVEATGALNAPRAATPIPAIRPAGARRWVVPAGLLSGAAVVAGLMFGLPNSQTGSHATLSELEFETAALAPADAPVPRLAPAPAAVPATTPAPQAAAASIVRSPVATLAPTAPAPSAEALADGAGASIAFGTAAVASGEFSARPPVIIGDKYAQSETPQGVATGATVPFDSGAVSGTLVPTTQSPGAIGNGLIGTSTAPQSEGSDAPEALDQDPITAPQSQRTATPQGSNPATFDPRNPLYKNNFRAPDLLKALFNGGARHG